MTDAEFEEWHAPAFVPDESPENPRVGYWRVFWRLLWELRP